MKPFLIGFLYFSARWGSLLASVAFAVATLVCAGSFMGRILDDGLSLGPLIFGIIGFAGSSIFGGIHNTLRNIHELKKLFK